MEHSWAASLVAWYWRRVIFFCQFEWVWGRKTLLCLCCASSAVLSGFGHSLPCEACRENVSHGVIVTNPVPHTQPPISFYIFPITSRHMATLPFNILTYPWSESRISCLVCGVEPCQKTFCQVRLGRIFYVIIIAIICPMTAMFTSAVESLWFTRPPDFVYAFQLSSVGISSYCKETHRCCMWTGCSFLDCR